MTRSYRARTAVLLAASAAFAACSDSTGPQAASVVSAIIAPSAAPPHTSIRVVLDEPGQVQVTYWRDADPNALEITSDVEQLEHELFLPRTREASLYHYQVRAVGAGGRLGSARTGSFATGPLPPAVAALQFAATGAPTDSLALIEVMISQSGFGGGAIIVDEHGRIVWYWQGQGGFLMGGGRRENGNWVFHDDGRLVELTADRRLVNELPNASPATPYGTIHHDVTVTPQNTLYFIANETLEFGDSTLVGEAIWEWFPEEHRVEKRWSAFDFLSWPADKGPDSALQNWLHMNSITVGARGNILYSSRSLDQVVSIAPDFQSIEWRLGGVNATIPVEGDAHFSGQHNISETAPDHILMWDNGRRRLIGEFSRGLEIAVDATAGTATRVAEFRGVPDRLQPLVGGAFRMPGGNTLITYGFGGGDQINIYEIGAGGSILWHLEAPAAVVRIYKARTLSSIAGERTVPKP